MPPKRPFSRKFKIQLKAGAATPAPPVGPVLGQYGVNIQQFCVAYNDGTADLKGSGLVIPVICYVFEDKSFLRVDLPISLSPIPNSVESPLNKSNGNES